VNRTGRSETKGSPLLLCGKIQMQFYELCWFCLSYFRVPWRLLVFLLFAGTYWNINCPWSQSKMVRLQYLFDAKWSSSRFGRSRFGLANHFVLPTACSTTLPYLILQVQPAFFAICILFNCRTIHYWPFWWMFASRYFFAEISLYFCISFVFVWNGVDMSFIRLSTP